MASKKITIILSESNAWELKIVAAVLKRPVSEIVSFCLAGSTNLEKYKNLKDIFCKRGSTNLLVG